MKPRRNSLLALVLTSASACVDSAAVLWSKWDAGPDRDPCSSCLGCCDGFACLPGTDTLRCGAASACHACGADTVCLRGACRDARAPLADLSVTDVVVTNVATRDGGFDFDLSVTLLNLGSQAANDFAWGIALSNDATFRPDDVFVAATSLTSLSGFASVRSTLRATVNASPGAPTVTAFAVVDLSSRVEELSEDNNALGRPFARDGSDCNATTCAGCCSTRGCVRRTEVSTAMCGSSGEWCRTCSPAQTCRDGACE